MRKISIIFCCCLFSLAACDKKTTNNYTTVLPVAPAYTVNGINDITINHNDNYGYTSTTVPITIQYQDSAQQTVTVTVSGIPTTSGGTQDGVIGTGVPTYTCSVNFIYNSDNHNIPLGTYPITVTTVGSVSGTKIFKFNLIVK